MLSFPRYSISQPDGHVLYGAPERAVPCRCLEGPLEVPMADTCLRCGHHPVRTIDETWSERARVVALQAAGLPALKVAA